MLVRSLIYGWGFDFMRPFQESPCLAGHGDSYLSIAAGFF